MILGIWGEDKTCKTTLALSAPKPLVVMELDIGGFERAKRNLNGHLPILDWCRQGLITCESYAMPITAIGSIDLSRSVITPSKRIAGMKELFYAFLGSYLRHLQNPKLATIVVDTATILKQVTDDAYLQEKQEAQFDTSGKLLQNQRLREQLTQIEYKEPNTRTRGIYYNAKAAGKNLILVHHARDEYKSTTHTNRDGNLVTENMPTGKRERAGFSTLGDSADMIVHTYVERQSVLGENGKPVIDQVAKKPVTKPVPYCEVELSEVLELVGMRFEQPTFDGIQQAIKMIRGE